VILEGVEVDNWSCEKQTGGDKVYWFDVWKERNGLILVFRHVFIGIPYYHAIELGMAEFRARADVRKQLEDHV
jgi:hypothetical protein